jgi:TMEM175 potassium channel family protein
MPTLYNRIQGQNVERLAALSDGIFAVAMTLLVLDLHVPLRDAIHSEHELHLALLALAPQFLTYLMSFLTLGIFWAGQQTQLNHLERADRDLSWLHLAFLSAISMMPFTTRLLAEFITYRTSLVLYWLNILVAGALLYISWRYATRARLIKPDTPVEIQKAVCRRVIIAQSLYAFGALLCVMNTYWSIAFIVLVQLNYAIAPRILAGKSKTNSDDAAIPS